MKLFFCIPLFLLPIFMQGQVRLFSKSAKISFFSSAPLEDIEARNNNVVTAWDVSTGQLEFSLLIRGFEFKKALMQQHFNENYMESDKYPKAIFKGRIIESNTIPLQKEGDYIITVNGDITIHGITRTISFPAAILVKDKIISAKAEFTVAPADFNIEIPGIVADNISKQIKIKVYVPDYKSFPGR
ncbi:MAG: YceI family protein [Ginsengibacter sp.]|jgi:hypothetical protein